MKIVSAAEMRAIDRVTSERFGVPSLTLMENAGGAVAAFVMTRFPEARHIGVICGKGNNGGDGLVAARQLHAAGREVQLLLLSDPAELRGDAAENFTRLPVEPLLVRSAEDLDAEPARAVMKCDVLLDAILGTGFKPPVSTLYAEAISRMNAGGSKVVAVDIPSGAEADLTSHLEKNAGVTARADAIVTFIAPRPSHVFASLTEGLTLIAPIGSPAEAITSSQQINLVTAHDLAGLVAARKPGANKGTFGHVLVIGGATGKAGAAAMAGMAALRAGAGLSTVGTPKSVLPTVAGFHPELMTEPLEETEIGSISLRALGYGHVDALAKGKSVLAVGPGISRHTETAEFVRTVVKKFKTPMVLDADGLNAFEGRAAELKGEGRTLVLTPHPGEMARLTGLSIADVERDRIGVARSFAREHQVILVLKGHRTLIAQPDGIVWVNATGNPGMATGGTGDILTGMISGLMAQNRDATADAVIAAVHLHGLAGDVAREIQGEHSMTATDLLHALPEAFRRTREAARMQAVEIHG